MADKELTERRVYNLPTELLERLRDYQTHLGISSETEAARRLLDSALQMRDTIETILKKLRSRYADEKELRALATDVLTNHILVRSVHFDEREMQFILANGDRGKIDIKGLTYIGGNDVDDWDLYPPEPRKPQNPWDSPRNAVDLDDEIPF